MFVGHFGVGLAAKKIDPGPSLGTLFMASQFIDLLWPIFLLIGLEKVKVDPGNTVFTPLDFIYYPFSHGFISVLIWSILFGIVYFIIKKNIKSSVLLGSLVMSHWILDLITHRPDLPLFPWSELKAGFGLWNSIIFTLLIELLIFFAGVVIYLRETRSKNKRGNIGLWSLLIFLLIIYFINVFGPPPPSDGPIAIAGLALWLVVAWAYWIDRNRKLVNVH